VTALRAAGGPAVGYAEFPGATHGFESLHSVRGERFVEGSALVLTNCGRAPPRLTSQR